jgi:hypothetical protein
METMASRDQTPVTLTVNGERWSLRSTLADCGPDGRVFTVRVSDKGGTVISFGDGVHGKSLPPGGRLSLTIASETPLPVSLERTAGEPTPDQALWTVIRRQTDATEFELYTPCEDTHHGTQGGENARHGAACWRLTALLLGVALVALALWCGWAGAA